jgi:hypothetical protein
MIDRAQHGQRKKVGENWMHATNQLSANQTSALQVVDSRIN